MNRALIDYIPETEAFGDETSILGEVSGQAFLDEFDEMELAADLLEIRDEAALDRFVTRLLLRRLQDGKKEAPPAAAQALRPILKEAAAHAIPRRQDGMARRPTAQGRAENEAAQYFGLDPEGLSDEDREFEVARSFVRFADAVLRQSATQPDAGLPGSPAVARKAALHVARRYAPGLLRALRGPAHSAPSAARSPAPAAGRWQRQGPNLVIVGC